jgi:hypothetical protein
VIVETVENREVAAPGHVWIETGRFDKSRDAIGQRTNNGIALAAEHRDSARIALNQSEQNAKQRRFPGAVRAEQAMDVACMDDESDITQRVLSAVSLGHSRGLERWAFGHCAAS